MRLLVLLLSFISLSSFACSSAKTTDEVAAFMTQNKSADVSHIEVYYPLVYGEAKAFRAEISFGSSFDEPVLTVPTFVTEPFEQEQKPELIHYRVSTFQLSPGMLEKAFITIYYKPPKSDDGLLTFCMGPISIYKISDLPEKKV